MLGRCLIDRDAKLALPYLEKVCQQDRSADYLFDLARCAQGTCELHLRQQQLRIRFSRTTEPRGCLVPLLQRLQNQPQSKKCVGGAGIKSHGLSITGFGLLQPVRPSQQLAEIAVIHGRGWLMLDGSANSLQGQIVVPARRIDQPEQMKGVGMAGSGRKDLLVDLRRFVQPPGLMVGDGRFHGLGDGGIHDGKLSVISV